MRNVRLLIIVSLVGTVLGCGQKGPLVLPETQHQHKKAINQKVTPPAAPQPSGTAPGPHPAPPDATATGDAKTAPPP